MSGDSVSKGIPLAGVKSPTGRTTGAGPPEGALFGGVAEGIGGRRGRGVPVGRLLLTTLRRGRPGDRRLDVGVR